MYIQTLFLQAAKALASLRMRICADLPEPLLLVGAISTKISCTDPRDSIGNDQTVL